MSDEPKLCTTNGRPVAEVRASQTNETGQHAGYIVLCDDERAKGFVQPYRDSYRHVTCGTVTTMGRALSETYARDPSFYSHTFCVGCNRHLPVAEFVWTADGVQVGAMAPPAAPEIPRRADMRRMTPIERKILDLVGVIEGMPADVRLTDAQCLLGAARDSVADYVDGVDQRRYVHIERK